jgi:hypothetical protein
MQSTADAIRLQKARLLPSTLQALTRRSRALDMSVAPLAQADDANRSVDVVVAARGVLATWHDHGRPELVSGADAGRMTSLS